MSPPTNSAQQQRMGQISCRNCRVTLGYPLGAPSVRCPCCQSVTPIQQIHVSCHTCRTVLLLPANTSVAMCPRCRSIMQIPPHLQNPAGAPGGTSAASSGPGGGPIAPPKECAYIERPSLRDGKGKRITNFAIGTKQEDDRI